MQHSRRPPRFPATRCPDWGRPETATRPMVPWMYVRMATSGGSPARGWLTYTVVALAAGVACALYGDGSDPWRAAYVAVTVSSGLVAATALRRAAGSAWLLVVLAEFAFAAGNVLTHDARRLFGRPLANPWLPNLPSLAGYAFVFAAILALVRARGHG